MRFQSTFPRGERQKTIADLNENLQVSIHVPARGTTNSSSSHLRVRRFQSTFPRGERQYVRYILVSMSIVSIHVPARGTTETVGAVLRRWAVSIHVPARGTTKVRGSNPEFPYVSIHVPARGTTSLDIHILRLEGGVSIHVPARGTTEAGYNVPTILVFQSTFPRGERLGKKGDVIIPTEFQSTFPRGERPVWNGAAVKKTLVSIHVPARGTTSPTPRRKS